MKGKATAGDWTGQATGQARPADPSRGHDADADADAAGTAVIVAVSSDCGLCPRPRSRSRSRSTSGAGSGSGGTAGAKNVELRGVVSSLPGRDA